MFSSAQCPLPKQWRVVKEWGPTAYFASCLFKVLQKHSWPSLIRVDLTAVNKYDTPPSYVRHRDDLSFYLANAPSGDLIDHHNFTVEYAGAPALFSSEFCSAVHAAVRILSARHRVRLYYYDGPEVHLGRHLYYHFDGHYHLTPTLKFIEVPK